MSVSYKSVLLGSSRAHVSGLEEIGPLTPLELRNRESLRAWRERALQPHPDAPLNPRRSWLASFGWADSAGRQRHPGR